MISPVLDKITQDSKYKLVKVDTDENMTSAASFQISALPTVMAFKDGKMIGKFVGFRNEGAIRKWLEEL
jgi:thioredoxin 1